MPTLQKDYIDQGWEALKWSLAEECETIQIEADKMAIILSMAEIGLAYQKSLDERNL